MFSDFQTKTKLDIIMVFDDETTTDGDESTAFEGGAPTEAPATPEATPATEGEENAPASE